MNRDSPSVVAEVGGLVEESSVSLAVYNDNLDPAEVTRLLGVEPTESFPPGYRRGPRSPAIKHGAWFLTVEGVAPSSPDECLRVLLSRLPAEKVIWEQLRLRYEVQIRIGIHFNAWNRGFALSAETMDRIAKLGVPMEFDLYAYTDEDA